MLIYLGAWGIREGFGKRCGLEAIRGFVGFGSGLKETLVIGGICWRTGKSYDFGVFGRG